MPKKEKRAKKDPKLVIKQKLIKAKAKVRADLAKKFGRKVPK